MPASHSFVLRVPLPHDMPASFAINHIQTYEPLITTHPYLVRYTRRPVSVAELESDPFFRDDGRKLQSFLITERIKILPGVSKDIDIPAVFQSFETGARVRADAQGGVRVWTTYGVEPAEAGRPGWDLVERAHLTCGSLVKPFVVSSIEPAHSAICHSIVEDLIKAYASGGAGAGEGKPHGQAGVHAYGQATA